MAQEQVEYPGEEHKVQDDQKTQGRYHFNRGLEPFTIEAAQSCKEQQGEEDR